MPRNRPAALRAAQQEVDRRAQSTRGRIPGLSWRTSQAIQRIEWQFRHYHFGPGSTDTALRHYRAFLTPGSKRPLYPCPARCCCNECAFDDVRHARDVLRETLHHLRGRPRSELRQLIDPLDADFDARSLPDPFAAHFGPAWREVHHDTTRLPWWYRRLALGAEDRAMR